jgi:hypothetical protein
MSAISGAPPSRRLARERLAPRQRWDAARPAGADAGAPLIALILALLLAASAHAATTGNDESCDISILPAATLLLPYFEVDLESTPGDGETTIFTVTNNTRLPQIAHVTLWTDYAYPVIDFNIFLTGYDVQSINLHDVIARGHIAPDGGTGIDVSPAGELSENDNPLADESSCEHLPVVIPQVFITRMRSAFTTGKVPPLGAIPACNSVGGIHHNAVGYATIDVVGTCSTSLPTEPQYYSHELRFDNVLTGDYIQFNANEDFAEGGAMVHIRAIPEGGTPQTRAGNPELEVESPRTFYSRYLPAGLPFSDARQPLPSTFHARWIDGGANGFETHYKIWREGSSAATVACSAYPASNGLLGIVDLVRFDDEENFDTLAPDITVTPIYNAPTLPATSRVAVEDARVFPENPTNSVSGWTYLNLDASRRDGFASQAWVVTSMRAEDRYAFDADAAALGNGCSPATPVSQALERQFGPPIGPAPDGGPAATANDASCDISTLPAATLLLPYFEVDFNQRFNIGETTTFTITNTTNLPQVAQVTLWTDYAYPVVEFSIFLTGYDAQTIDLFDVIARGQIAPEDGTGYGESPVGRLSGHDVTQRTFDNPSLDEESCVDLPVQLPRAMIERMQAAFTTGKLACSSVGGAHRNAVGYATIDVVGACSALNPSDDGYFDRLIRFDNVLTGVYMQLNGLDDFAQGGTLVHIRAIDDFDAPRTFYSRFHHPSQPALDRRQPLPSTFSARWIAGDTHFKIWREGASPASRACNRLPANGAQPNTDLVRFDEEENPTAYVFGHLPPLPIGPSRLPVTSRADLDDEDVFPFNDGAPAGWMYLNLDASESDGFATQNWVISSIRAQDRFSVDVDAAALGNGCSAPVPRARDFEATPIGPAPNKRP